jgi:hypothetical protein
MKHRILVLLGILYFTYSNEISPFWRLSKERTSQKQKCFSNSDCERSLYVCKKNKCSHKSFFSPITINELSLALATFVMTGLCMSVGMGGK